MRFKEGQVITNGKISGIISGINHSAKHYLICDSNEDFLGLIKEEEAYDKAIQPFDKFATQEVIAPEDLHKFDSSKCSPPSDQSLRLNQGKIQTREVDPSFILGIGEVLTKSRHKYDHFNWTKPTKLSTPYESAMRHLMAFQSGENIDPEDGTSHLLKVATNIMFMYYHITNNPDYSDDRFFKKKDK